MDIKEAAKIMAVLETAYPQYYKTANEQEKKNAVGLWQDMFSDTPAASVALAVKALIATCKFPPTIAEVREYIQKLSAKDGLTADKAWQQVMEAVFGVDADSPEAVTKKFNALPEITRSILGNPRQLIVYGSMYEIDLQRFEKPRFVRSFEARQAATREFERLPGPVREQSMRLKAADTETQQIIGGKNE